MVGKNALGRKFLESKNRKITPVVVFGMLLACMAHARQPTTLFKRLSPSVVVVETLDANGSVVSIGSGVVVAQNQMVTNRHVVDAGWRIRVRRGDKTLRAFLTWVDPDHDLAQLRADGLSAPPISFRLSSTLAVGERVYAIGTPEGLEMTLSEGIISGLREYQNGRLIQTSASLSPGSSGGGLFDEQGRLVGITAFGLSEGQNLNFALPIEWVRAFPTQRSFANPQTPATQQQTTKKYEEVFRHAWNALNNLETMVQERRLLHDSTYRSPPRGGAVSGLITNAMEECSGIERGLDCFDNWPLWQQASLMMFQLRQEIQAAQPSRDEIEGTFLNAARSAWSALGDIYCKDRPGGLYTDLEDKIRACPNAHEAPPASSGNASKDQ